MFKKILSTVLAICLMFVLCSCGADTSEGAKKFGYDNKSTENMVTFIETTEEKYSTDIEEKTTALIEALGESFDGYKNGKAKITEYYTNALADFEKMAEALKTVTGDYYRYVAKDCLSEYKIWNKAMEDAYKAWNNAMEDYYNSWGDCFKKVYEACNDLIELGYDKLSYNEYSKEFSDMYNEYSDAWSDMYEKYSDIWKELYETYSDVWGEFYDGKIDIEDILKSEPKSKNETKDEESSENNDKKDDTADEVGESSENSADSTSFDTLEISIVKETEKAVEKLKSDYEALSKNITTYSDYVANAPQIEKFYDKINLTSAQISKKLYEYSASYAEKIMKSGLSADDMYDAFDGLYDCIYEDAADVLYDGIYDGILETVYDDFYDGILDERDDSVSYEDWSEARSNEYKMWSETRSDCYKQWSDLRSDVYELWSDMRSEMYSNDIERAQKILNDFMKDVRKMSV